MLLQILCGIFFPTPAQGHVADPQLIENSAPPARASCSFCRHAGSVTHISICAASYRPKTIAAPERYTVIVTISTTAKVIGPEAMRGLSLIACMTLGTVWPSIAARNIAAHTEPLIVKVAASGPRQNSE